MYKRTIAFLFAILFMALIVTPTVIIALDDSFDTSIFFSITEEEENSKAKNVIASFSVFSTEAVTNFNLKNYQIFSFRFKTYPKPHLNLISPPPEQIIL